MGKTLFTIANVIVIEYLLMTHYGVPYKWGWLAATAIVLTAVFVRKKPPSD